jgi:hypothetical protein
MCERTPVRMGAILTCDGRRADARSFLRSCYPSHAKWPLWAWAVLAIGGKPPPCSHTRFVMNVRQLEESVSSVAQRAAPVYNSIMPSKERQ